MIIYKITNIINGKIYIGKTTSLDVFKYINMHFNNAMNNNDKNKKYLYNAIRKYGSINFKWEIIFSCLNTKELNDMEKFFIATYKATNEMYNMSIGGDGGDCFSNLTEERKEECRDKLRKQRKGIKRSEEIKEKMRKPKSIEGKQNIKLAHPKGFWNVDRPHPMLGKTHSLETKKKLSDARKGKPGSFKGKSLSEESKQKLRDNAKTNPNYGMKGKKHSEETKKKIRDSNIKAKSVEKNSAKNTKGGTQNFIF